MQALVLSQPSAGRAKEAVVQPRRQVAHNRLYSPTSIAKDTPRVKPPQAFKRQFWLTQDWCTLGRGEAFAKGTGRKN